MLGANGETEAVYMTQLLMIIMEPSMAVLDSSAKTNGLRRLPKYTTSLNPK